jgi:CDP-glucose 4,6-dehydratase
MESLAMRSALSAYYQGKKVFVTGHTGFKGAWLTAVLHTLGAQVKGYALPPEYEKGLFDVLQPLEIGESVFNDIRRRDLLKKEISVFQPDYIFPPGCSAACAPIVSDSCRTLKLTLRELQICWKPLSAYQ